MVWPISVAAPGMASGARIGKARNRAGKQSGQHENSQRTMREVLLMQRFYCAGATGRLVAHEF